MDADLFRQQKINASLLITIEALEASMESMHCLLSKEIELLNVRVNLLESRFRAQDIVNVVSPHRFV